MGSTGKLSVDEGDGLVTITGEGELSLYIAPQLNDLLKDAVASGNEVAVDLARAFYIDSAILGALVTAGKAAGNRRKLKVVLSEDTQPRYVMRVSGLDVLLDIVVVENDQPAR